MRPYVWVLKVKSVAGGGDKYGWLYWAGESWTPVALNAKMYLSHRLANTAAKDVWCIGVLEIDTIDVTHEVYDHVVKLGSNAI